MLVITKKQRDGYIKIGDDIRIVVLRVEGGRARIGIDAPLDTKIENRVEGAQDGVSASEKSEHGKEESGR